MKNIFKKTLSLTLSFVIALGAFSAGSGSLANVMDCFTIKASAAEATKSGTCGKSLTWTLDDKGTLTISGTGNMDDYHTLYNYLDDINDWLCFDYIINSPWYSFRDKIKKIIISDSVTHIGRGAFYDCTELISVTIPNSVVSIGEAAFAYCTSLPSITIPKGATSIGDDAFYKCTSITSITIPDSVTSIGDGAFEACTSIESITIPDSVTSIGYGAFKDTGYYSENENWDENGILYIGNHLIKANADIEGEYTIKDGTKTIADSAFISCSNLKNITIPDSVKSIGSDAFYNCENLTSIVIPDSVTTIGARVFDNTAYYNEKANWDNGNVLYLNSYLITTKDTLSGDYKIKDGTKIIADFAFFECKGLENITIPESVTKIGDNAFYNCSSLTSINVEEGNAVYDSRNNCNAINETATNTLIAGCKNTDIPNTITRIGDYAFAYCEGLIRITIPYGVTSIGGNAFYFCKNLTIITIPKSVKNIGADAFEYCIKLSYVYYSGNKSDRNNMEIGYGNDYFENAKWQYNSVNNVLQNINIAQNSLKEKIISFFRSVFEMFASLFK